MKKKQELIEEWESAVEAAEFYGKGKEERLISYMKDFVSDLKQLDEPEVLSKEWIDEHKHYYPVTAFNNSAKEIVDVEDLQNLLVPKQEEPTQEQVQKYLSEHGIEVVKKEPETVADVVTTFWKSFERLKEVMSMEVEELEE